MLCFDRYFSVESYGEGADMEKYMANERLCQLGHLAIMLGHANDSNVHEPELKSICVGKMPQ